MGFGSSPFFIEDSTFFRMEPGTGLFLNYELSHSNMKTSHAHISVFLVTLFLGSLMIGFTDGFNTETSEVFEEEPQIQNPSQATSPGHVVFGQYISSDNCGHLSLIHI